MLSALMMGSLFDLKSGNRYTYVEDDPVNLVDPSGKDFMSCFWAGVDLNFALWGLWVTLAGIASAIIAPNPLSVFVAAVGTLIFIESVRSLIGEIQACLSGS